MLRCAPAVPLQKILTTNAGPSAPHESLQQGNRITRADANTCRWRPHRRPRQYIFHPRLSRSTACTWQRSSVVSNGSRSSQGSPEIYSLLFSAITSGFATEALATKAAAIVVKSMKIIRTMQKMISKMSPSSSIDQKGFMECFQQSRLGWQESRHTSKQRCLACRHSFKKRKC